ncbi:small CPxCG-related zinc finger protein (plasmid) [Haloferax volcanii DS2]|uniref:Small CPxCG-related zinc finger protein n=1 Tax=Haloferax volcanii (strain ATCC 29605 / DSM 3757 / JCM 8879 / NBRC 14742 / NCIMB 2012 / VKM B-1768 / DS2) TaxID=309800 RepID=A0A1C9J6S8_HALVD|nr:small CPxCG-related zinc finger protein [Haloferax volcanii DS2]
MRCPKCSHSLAIYDSFYDIAFVCDSCGYVLPRGAD